MKAAVMMAINVHSNGQNEMQYQLQTAYLVPTSKKQNDRPI